MKLLPWRTGIIAAALSLLFLAVSGCSNPTNSPPTSATPTPLSQDVSSDMATVVADLNLAQSSSLQANFIDESTTATETSTSVAASNGVARMATVAVTISVTTTHTVPSWTSGTQFAAGDVVQVVRTWTNAEGETVVDTVTRPKIPSLLSDYSLTSYTPTAGSTSISIKGISATVSNQVWTLNCTETKTINSIPFVEQNFTMVYQWGSSLSTPRAEVVSITKAGENINLYTTRVKLTSTIYYTYDTATKKDFEYLRVLDFIGTKSNLGRQVYAWGITPSTSMGIPPLYDSSLTSGTTGASALTFTPLLAPELGRTTDSLWYYSDPSVAVSTLVPAYTGTTLSTYPKLDVSHWIGSVLQESGPRIADWYKPIPNTAGNFVGNYFRRNEHTYYTGGSTNKIYSLTDGVALISTVGTLVYQTAGNGTVTTTKKFSDGITSTVTITPTDDAAGNITGYVITRGTTTYTVVYAKDTTGDPTSISVTNSSTGKTKVYTNTSGTWS